MIAIADYGVGNLASVAKAFAAVGARAELVAQPERLAEADAIVLPGVGNFGHCATEFKRAGFEAPLREAHQRDVPILGTCVGMQLLFEGSEEDSGASGLGFLDGTVVRIRAAGDMRVPHMGWNDIRLRARHPWLRDISDGDYFYFVHSYVPETSDDLVMATVDYGGSRVAIAGNENVLGVQFHPEKSGANGLRLLRAFADAVSS